MQDKVKAALEHAMDKMAWYYSVDQLFLTSHFVSEELSFHSSQHWSILHENWWKSTAFDHSINVSDCFCLLWSNENFSFQKLATHTS